MESSLDFANASRWLIKASTISEDTTLNNSFFTNAKYTIGDNITNSANIYNNIWVSSYGDKSLTTFTDLDSLNTFTVKNSSSYLNDFESSRLWNQKRNFYTTLLKASFTKEHLNFSDHSNTITSFFTTNGYYYLAPSINLSYAKLKENISCDGRLSDTYDKNDSQLNYFYIVNSGLDGWALLDKNMILTLCQSETEKNSVNLFYQQLAYSNLYYNAKL
jgi:hypothetical protein